MCCGNNGGFGGGCWWIIILMILLLVLRCGGGNSWGEHNGCVWACLWAQTTAACGNKLRLWLRQQLAGCNDGCC